jgi:hypothetical protein
VFAQPVRCDVARRWPSSVAALEYTPLSVFNRVERAMPAFRTALLAGAAAIGIAAFSGLAAAQSPQVHVMNVALPDGGTAQVRYIGDVPPRVTFSTAPAAIADWAPMPALPAMFGPDSPFAMLDRVSAEMDRQAAAMFRQAEALTTQAQSGQPIPTAVQNLPPGSQSYSFISTMSSNGVCSQSVEITSTGNGPPKVVRHSSGNCGPTAGGTVGAAGDAVAVPAMTPSHRPDTLWIKDNNPPPYRGLIQKTALAN